MFLDLGTAPPSNAYLDRDAFKTPELWYPLRLLVCEECWLVQTEDYAEREQLFTDDYAYFSSISTTLTTHAERFVSEAIRRFSISPSDTVVEIAANDGYLLQFFQQRGIPCYGIEPTRNTANAARSKGIEIVEEFFGEELSVVLATQGKLADIVIANNVLAHVPDINDFVSGVRNLLRQSGVAIFEFHHLLKMIKGGQFDIAYHEHYSYLSLGTVLRIFAKNGLQVFDVQEILPHGGSLRIYAQRVDAKPYLETSAVSMISQKELIAGLSSRNGYLGFQAVAEKIKNEFLAFLVDAKRNGKSVAAYGAAAKGTTLLNFAGVRPDLLMFVCDAAPSKQDKFLPGSRIPIVAPTKLGEHKPDFIVVLPWNIADEIKKQIDHIRDWGGKFVVAVPKLVIQCES